MKIFIQISVGGFKVFDIDSFIHTHNDLRYIYMGEIYNVEQTRTHLVNYDMHGIRNETCGLFSCGNIEILFHNDTIDSLPTTMLFIKSGGNIHDKGEDRKISTLFVSEKISEYAFLKNLAIAKALEDKQTERLLWRLLTETFIDSKQVIAFDNSTWGELIRHIKHQEFSNRVENILGEGNQLVILRHEGSLSTIEEILPGLLNCHPYLVLTPTDFSKIKNGEKLNKQPSVLSKEFDFSFEELKSKARSAIKLFLTKVTNKLDNYTNTRK